MQAGKLRHPVLIEKRNPGHGTRDATGAFRLEWETHSDTWAEIRQLKGRELYVARQVHAEATFRISFRHVSGVTPKMRVKHKLDNRVFDLLSVDNVHERDREMVCMASQEGVNA